MDYGRFDALTRSVANRQTTRRTALRLLAGGSLGVLAAWLGLGDGAEAKPKRKARKEARPRAPLGTEGKRKGKKPGKKKPKPPCGPGRWQCADGSCVAQAQCCVGERRCPDGSCRSEDQCCNDQKRCYDGSCVAAGQCCADEWPCSDGSCISPDQCCPDEKRCEDDSCIAQDQCCDDTLPQLCPGECQEEVCEEGEWVCRPISQECPPDKSFNADTCECECPDMFCPSPRELDPETCGCECANDGNFCPTGYAHLDYCCPGSHPVCWWAGGTRIGCVTEDQGDHVCPIGWSVMPGSDPEHRHCFPPPGVTERQSEDRPVEQRRASVAAADTRGARTAARGRRGAHDRAGRQTQRAAAASTPDS